MRASVSNAGDPDARPCAAQLVRFELGCQERATRSESETGCERKRVEEAAVGVKKEKQRKNSNKIATNCITPGIRGCKNNRARVILFNSAGIMRMDAHLGITGALRL